MKKGIKWIILIPTIAVIISIIYVLFIAKPIYTSNATLLLVNSGGSQSKYSSIASQFGFSLPSSTANMDYISIETLPEILTSRTLAKSIMYKKFNSLENSESTSLVDIVTGNNDVTNTGSNKVVLNVVKYISGEMLKINQIKNTSMFYYQ